MQDSVSQCSAFAEVVSVGCGGDVVEFQSTLSNNKMEQSGIGKSWSALLPTPAPVSAGTRGILRFQVYQAATGQNEAIRSREK